jgi:hypothetical protein
VTYGPPAEAFKEAARLLLLQDTQAGIRRDGLEGPFAETRTYDVEGFAEKRVITLGGRQKNYLRVAYNRSVLPILPTRHPLSQVTPGGGSQNGSLGSHHNGHEEPIPHVDHTGAPERMGREESLLRMQEASQEVGEAEDSALSGAQNGTDTALLVDDGGPVRAPSHQWLGEQAFPREGVGDHLRVHIDVPGPRGDSGYILHGSFLMAVRRFMALHGAPKRFQSD